MIDKLKPLPSEDAMDLRRSHTGIPEDYVEFLEMIGAGTLGRSQYSLYSGPVDPEEIYGETCEVRGAVIIGDDFSGCNVGFDLQNWEVIEIDSTDMQREVVATSFGKFIVEKIALLQSISTNHS